jgi:hypothetical protein
MKNGTTEALWASPPIATGGLVLLGVTLNNWVIILTLIYTLFLIVDKLHTVIERIKQFRAWLRGL